MDPKYRENYKDPHPCKTCITYAMCQARLQEHIRHSTMERGYEYDYCDMTGDESSHKDTIMLAFYIEMAHCDILQTYIENRVNHRNKFRPDSYPVMREAITIDVLYEAFNISLTHILDLNS